MLRKFGEVPKPVRLAKVIIGTRGGKTLGGVKLNDGDTGPGAPSGPKNTTVTKTGLIGPLLNLVEGETEGGLFENESGGGADKGRSVPKRGGRGGEGGERGNRRPNHHCH